MNARDGDMPSGARRGRPPAEHSGRIQDRILKAAGDLILERGVARLSVEEVAAAAHASKTTIYSRFPSKDAIFQEFVRSQTEHHLATLAESLRPGARPCPEDALAAIVSHATAEPQVRFLRALIAESERQPDIVRAAHYRIRDGYVSFLCATCDIDADHADELLRTEVARRQLEALMAAHTGGR